MTSRCYPDWVGQRAALALAPPRKRGGKWWFCRWQDFPWWPRGTDTAASWKHCQTKGFVSPNTVAASLGFIHACRDLPHQVGEASGQVHCGWAAAEHGQDALQVEELQELVTAAHNTHIHTQDGYESSSGMFKLLFRLICRPSVWFYWWFLCLQFSLKCKIHVRKSERSKIQDNL